MPQELVVGVVLTAILATVTAFAWAPPDELLRRLLKRSLRQGHRDPVHARRSAEVLLQRVGMIAGMLLFATAFVTGWMAIRMMGTP